jgi:hypothetical protein
MFYIYLFAELSEIINKYLTGRMNARNNVAKKSLIF